MLASRCYSRLLDIKEIQQIEVFQNVVFDEVIHMTPKSKAATTKKYPISVASAYPILRENKLDLPTSCELRDRLPKHWDYFKVTIILDGMEITEIVTGCQR